MIPHSRLTCDEALPRLDEYVDGRLSPAELGQVEAHLADCLQCAEEFRFESALLQGIRGRLRRLTIPPSLAHEIRRRLRTEPGAARKEPFPPH